LGWEVVVVVAVMMMMTVVVEAQAHRDSALRSETYRGAYPSPT